MAKPKLWLGLSTVGVLVTSVLLAGRQLSGDYAGLINDALGLSTQKISNIDSTEVEGSAYKDADGSLSDKGWKRMIADSYNFCEEAVEQGSVLLKNENNALPLKKTERKVTLLGKGSKNMFMRSGAGGAAPWWKVTVDVITISAGTVTVALFGMYIFTEIVSKKKAAKPVEAAE